MKRSVSQRSWVVPITLGIIAAFSPATRADSNWSIEGFTVSININADASVDVIETIDAHFLAPKHGILREIPIRYAVGMHQYALRFRLEEVDDGQGHPHPTSISQSDNLVRIRIGDPERTVRGRIRYRLHYLVERAILWEGNSAWDQGEIAVLRWNATGTEWPVPISRAVVTVHLPRDLEDSRLVYDAWTGRFGERRKDFTARRIDSRTVEFATGLLRPREGISIEIVMPSDAVARPGWTKRLSWWLVDNFPYGVFPATLAACFLAWYLQGRDQPGMGTIVVHYEPPEDLRPAEVGTLIDERVDLRDISATIIDLAVRGYLQIEEVETSSWFTSGKDYRFLRLKGPEGLKPFERDLYDAIFGNRDSVRLSDLQEKFYPVIERVKRDLYRSLSKERFFDGNPDTIRAAFLVAGLVLVAATLAAASAIQFAWIGRVFPVPVIVAGVLSALAVAVTSRVMPRKTRKGRIAWERIAGLEEYIRRAEVAEIQEQERRGIFERLLPYAVIFGLSKRWGQAFADLYREPPDWYRPARPGEFSTWVLINDIDRTVWSMNQTFPTQPRSVGVERGAGYAWSSGGFGGGGGSGRGFGGGGGSSW